jgi:hypothetical protein
MSELKEKYKLLRNLFEGHYHQDVWEDFETDEEVWGDYFNNMSDKYKKLFYVELVDFVKESHGVIFSFVSEAARGGGTGFDSELEVVEFINELIGYTRKRLE